MEPAEIFENVLLTGLSVGKLRDVEEAVYEAVRKRGVLSKNATDSLLHKAISAVLGLEDGSEEVFEGALAHHAEQLRLSLQESPSQWEYFFRVVGFHTPDLPLKFGKVTFRLATPECVADLNRRMAAAIEKTSNSKHEKEAATALLSRQVSERFVNQAIAEVTTSALDSVAANSLAIWEVRKTLDVLNFLLNWRYPPDSALALPWEGHGSLEQFLSFRTGERESVCHSSSWKGGWVPVSAAWIKQAQGSAKASAMLLQITTGPFEDRLLSAMRWAGRAAAEERPDQRFLFFAMSLENLLLGSKKDSELAYRLRIRGAHLIGPDLEGKKKIQRHLRDLYQVRSQIVHSGSAQIKDSDMYLLQLYVKQAILTILTGAAFAEMKTEQDIEDWFDEQVLR
jgi:hypothetical protein